MSLKQLLDEQHRRLDELLTLLEHEQSCLVKGRVDGEQLQRLAQAKAELQQTLANTERRRHQAQLRLGYADDSHGARQAARDAGCENHWNQLGQRAEEVARANRRSGEILQLRMTQNSRILEQIHRLANPGVYYANGQVPLQSSRLDASA